MSELKIPNPYTEGEKAAYARKFKGYEEAFKKNQMVKKRASNRFSTESSRIYADICIQGNFNMDVRNNMITNDRRVEMAIVALR